MLIELKDVRQIPGEGFRRWFRDEYFDLIVWYDDEEKIDGFQLCYDREGNERAITWRRSGSYSHTRVDVGEIPGNYKMTPILVSDGVFDYKEVASQFKAASDKIDSELAGFVYNKLIKYNSG